MRFVILAAAALLMAVGVAFAQQGQLPLGTRISGVAEVYDADTVTINGVRIRLDGYDAPELGRQCAGGFNAGRHVRDLLRVWARDRQMTCVVTGYDGRNGRPVARCTIGGLDLGARLVRAGWARDWPLYSCGFYAADEAAARRERAGVWGMSCPNLWPENRDYARRCRAGAPRR